MQVMSPGFGPVFPRVRGRVGADIRLFPVECGAVSIVSLQAFRIVVALVAEVGTEGFELLLAAHQPHEIIMTRFVAEMAQQGSIRFLHRRADAFALRIVGFGDIHRNQAIVMARQYTFA